MSALLIASTGWIVVSRAQPDRDQDASAAPAMPREGFLAPDFALTTLEGQSIALSDLRGRVVLVNFWATWCPPCRLEMPAIQEVYEEYQEQGLVVLAINAQEPSTEITRFAEQLGLTFPIMSDRDGNVSGTYRVVSLPTTFVIDRSGVIRDVIVGGPLSRALIISKVEPLLAQGGSD
jgi:peroxiredoxin